MKQLFKLLLLTIVGTLSFALSSCDEEKNDAPNPGFIGTWRIAGISYDGVNYETWDKEQTTVTFILNEKDTKSGVFKCNGYYGEKAGLWKYDGKTIICSLKTGITFDFFLGKKVISFEEKIPITEFEYSKKTETECLFVNSDIGDDLYAWFYCVKLP